MNPAASATHLSPSLLRVTNADLHSNTYLLADSDTPAPGSACVIVDAGLDRAALEAALAACAWKPTAVLCTHGHFDHVGGAAWLQQTFQIPVYLQAQDLKLAKLSNFMMAAFKLKTRIALPEFSLLKEPASSLTLGAREFSFHPLPGHTPGGVGIATGQLLFSGDSLYARRTALSKLPGEDHAQLRSSLQWLFSWIDAQVLVLPGHGGAATIADIHTSNEALRAFMAEGQPA